MQDSKLFKVDIFEWYFGFCLQAKIAEQLLHEKISLFNHSQRTVKETHASKLCDSMKELPENITQSKIEYIQGNLQQVDTKKKRRFFCEEKDKRDFGKYAAQCSITAAIWKFKRRFPNSNESNVETLLKKYRENLKESKNESSTLKVGQNRDRPLLPGAALDLKLRSMIKSPRTAGARRTYSGCFDGICLVELVNNLTFLFLTPG